MPSNVGEGDKSICWVGEDELKPIEENENNPEGAQIMFDLEDFTEKSLQII